MILHSVASTRVKSEQWKRRMIDTVHIRRACLCLWVDLSAVMFQYLSDVDFVFLCTQMHRRESVLGSAVGVGAVVEQQSRHVRIADW